MPAGRFAPSPTGDLHLGNLRTGLLAWLFARVDGSPFHLRFEDLETSTVRPEFYHSQAGDLAALGIDFDGETVIQSERLDHYREVIADLVDRGLTYECFCSRREIREATQAPNGPWSFGHYPGTCRTLTRAAIAERTAAGRPPAIRLRADLTGAPEIEFVDRVCGPTSGTSDDLVIQRNDGTPAYNLVVVLDDVADGVELVVRADDLLSSTPRQIRVSQVLGLRTLDYAHVPLVLSPDGDRLAKRDGAVTLSDRRAKGETPAQVLTLLAWSLGLAEAGEPVTTAQLSERFDPRALPTGPWTLAPDFLSTD